MEQVQKLCWLNNLKTEKCESVKSGKRGGVVGDAY